MIIRATKITTEPRTLRNFRLTFAGLTTCTWLYKGMKNDLPFVGIIDRDADLKFVTVLGTPVAFVVGYGGAPLIALIACGSVIWKRLS